MALLVISVASLIFKARYKGNWPILQIECIEEFVFYALVYYYLFKNIVIKKTIILSIFLVSLLFLINAVFFQPFLKAFPTNVNLAAQILFTIFSLLLFKEMLLYPLKINIKKQSAFWFNTAILFYATTMFFTLGITNYIAEHMPTDKFIGYFWYFIIYLFHIFIGISLIADNKQVNAADTV